VSHCEKDKEDLEEEFRLQECGDSWVRGHAEARKAAGHQEA
jgi:hypothetical protein